MSVINENTKPNACSPKPLRTKPKHKFPQKHDSRVKDSTEPSIHKTHQKEWTAPKITELCDGFNNIVNESEEIRTILCADIVFASKYIRNTSFPLSKTFGEEITKIFNILNTYHKINGKCRLDDPKMQAIRSKSTHPYLKNKEAYNELLELSTRTDPQALSIILSKIPKYRNILTLFELYSIVRIINEFSIQYSQFIKTPYFEERLKLYEK